MLRSLNGCSGTNTALMLYIYQLCLAKGFICEICQKVDDVIFPFDLTRVILCTGKCNNYYLYHSYSTA